MIQLNAFLEDVTIEEPSPVMDFKEFLGSDIAIFVRYDELFQ